MRQVRRPRKPSSVVMYDLTLMPYFLEVVSITYINLAGRMVGIKKLLPTSIAM
jgi:hypothetical protein